MPAITPPRCPTCNAPVKLEFDPTAKAGGVVERATTGKFRCRHCGRPHPSKRSRGQHQHRCPLKPPTPPA